MVDCKFIPNLLNCRQQRRPRGRLVQANTEPTSRPLTLDDLVADFANGISAADASGVCAVNSRTGVPFQPGIGPHSEADTVRLVLREMALLRPTRYPAYRLGASYPSNPRLKCDLCMGADPLWAWAVEIKMMRLIGDNGKPNDNMLMHLLSPYPEHRSALTDCDKLVRSGLSCPKAILIYGYDNPERPLELGIASFETLAQARVKLGPRHSAIFSGLVHPVHRAGQVFAWEVS